MTRFARSLAAASLAFFAITAVAQTLSPTPEVSFYFERPGLSVPKFNMTVDEAGNARYEADEVIVASGGQDGEPTTTQHFSRTVMLSKVATARIFATARALDRFNVPCASKAKNIADTGAKTLRYSGKDGDGTCTYNFSENKRVVLLTNLFLGVARTLDVGRRLDFQHRFDRLGLDATIASFAGEVDGGRAAEIGVISPTLRSLVEDTAVLQRVRERAARLLEVAQSPS